ncbi:hypothetical protein, partial [Crocosphaera sp. Alani8]|uniref:hypothetical protein n=1 Tax=Crocosphaera sp. Alani8 TaxID=3038952 RepID=UPI00313B65E0
MFDIKHNRGQFIILYIGGILLTFICGSFFNAQLSSINSKFLLGLGVAHVLTLFFFNYIFFNYISSEEESEKSKRQIEDGNFIQTAGYLHTLIGFIVAVGLVGDDIDNINNLLSPLSSALVTSLLGWFLGGILVYEGEHKQPSLNEEIADAVAKEVEKALSESLKGLQENLEEYTKSFGNSFDELTEGISNGFDELNKKSQSLSFTFDTLNSTIKSKTSDLSTSCNGLITTIDIKRTTLDASFQEINDVVRSQKEPLANSFQGINTILDSQQQPLSDSFQRINNVLEQQQQPLSDSFQAINTVLKQQQQPLSDSFQAINTVL